MDTNPIYLIYPNNYNIIDFFDLCKTIKLEYSHIYLGVNNTTELNIKTLIEGCKYITNILYFKRDNQHKSFIKKYKINTFGFFNNTDDSLIKRIALIAENIINVDYKKKTSMIGGSIDRLQNIKYEDIPHTQLIYNGLFYGKVVKTYDGDTATIIFEYNNILVKHSCRLTFYNSAEINSTNTHEKQLAELQKSELSNLILNKVVRVLFHNKLCPYKRPLVTIFLLDDSLIDMYNSVNYMMIKKFSLNIYNPSKIDV